MNVAFVVYDGMTALDFVGVYDALTRLDTMGFDDEFAYDVCARRPVVTTGAGLRVEADAVDETLAAYDAVVVPGGRETRSLVDDERFLDWLGTADDEATLASVCTGSLLLGAAGFLEGRTATTHPTAYEALAAYCTVSDERVVEDGRVVTARGVASSLDLGLYLLRTFADDEVAAAVKTQMDYPYGPY